MASKTNPFTFFKQVRAEVAKVTWPSRRETVISTIMVLVMVVVASLLFLLVDFLFSNGVNLGVGLLSDLIKSFMG
ncbi:preprotein translocase subunit SecE [Bartonella sp. HY329]|uniref:preprotein translocase subunit SecE n=1 Tax=unclassified Bartonella TaxID=2645622 RepID=UPI0021C78BFA|nr:MULTISPECIES: preprotein translocase subunit SecE [unclassified Bartonella]UXM96027.1 preprotein translocase subunit SecE [Bartonella sp. HY329]UXN10352.1 preprotein translocase subunit SecE [Bartonella sp. HY328]